MQGLPNQENLQGNTNDWEDNTKNSNPTITDSLQTLDAIVITVLIKVMFGLIFIIPEWFILPNSGKYEKNVLLKTFKYVWKLDLKNYLNVSNRILWNDQEVEGYSFVDNHYVQPHIFTRWQDSCYCSFIMHAHPHEHERARVHTHIFIEFYLFWFLTAYLQRCLKGVLN